MYKAIGFHLWVRNLPVEGDYANEYTEDNIFEL